MEPIWSNDSPRLAAQGRIRPESGCAPGRACGGPRVGIVVWAALAVGCGSDSGPIAPPPPPLQPATVAVNGGDTQTATVGTAVPTPPSVRIWDADGTPVSGVSVRFQVVEGGGSVIGASALSDGSGVAAIGRWILGTAAGRNELRATVGGTSAVSFAAIATPAAPKTLVAVRGDRQTALAGSALPVDPAVAVHDMFANPVPDVTVIFSVEEGGGEVDGSRTTSDSTGIASVGSWRLGAAPGENTLSATMDGPYMTDRSVTFTATGTGGDSTTGYDIVIRFNPGSSPTTAQQQAFEAAEARWEQVIVGDLPDVAISRPNGACSSSSPIDETVDDLLIFVTLEAVDGPGGVLGSAGPCMIRSGSNLPLAGSIRFDTADLARLESGGLLDEVVLHEMGHVLGVGTLWNLFGLLADPAQDGGTDPHFIGPLAVAAFDALGGSGHPGAKVPVEDSGGSGTADAHWRESIFDEEVMTGWIDAGTNPLGAVTVSSLADHGYKTDPDAADPSSLSLSLSIVPRPGVSPLALRMVDDVALGPIEVVDARGRTERIHPD